MPKRVFRKNLEILFLSEDSRKLVQTLSNVKLSINPALPEVTECGVA
jgi:hypothetical protein